MEQERALIECKPDTIRQMKDDPQFLVQYVERYLKNNSGVTQPRASALNIPDPDYMRKDSQSLADMLMKIKKIKRELRWLKVKQVQFIDKNEGELNKSILKILKRIENLTEKIHIAPNDNEKELVVVLYEESEWVSKLRDWKNESV